MIYITGDCHGDFGRFHESKLACLPFELKKEDYVIVTGDFGLIWSENMIEKTAFCVKLLKKQPATILWVTGNHENYDLINAFPVSEWNGGKVRHIVKNKIILLERGQVFEIDGKKFFTFGGASSHDIDGGILERDNPDYREKVWYLEAKGIPYRVNHLSWWAQELPSEEEMEEGRMNLEIHDYKVDYVISHCASNRIGEMILKEVCARFTYRSSHKNDILTGYFEEIENKLSYEHWFCGHYHINYLVDSKHTVLYENIVPLDYYMEGRHAIKRYLK